MKNAEKREITLDLGGELMEVVRKVAEEREISVEDAVIFLLQEVVSHRKP